MNAKTVTRPNARSTTILPVDASKVGAFSDIRSGLSLLDDWNIELNEGEEGVEYLKLAAEELRTSEVPVAFPTETVYGLGADATRSEAVKGIYKAKQRPSDNPLIVHFASLGQLKSLLSSKTSKEGEMDVIPAIYKPLIKRFWPGPLTIILPNPASSPLAPEVTAGLSTFGARMPRNLLALLLIKLSGKPIAAPSANASTKPSPTAAEHVKEDLDGRIDYIIDGGPCDVGVESTVVDGLSSPPSILRPGGISIEQIRACSGWENVVVGYEDVSMKNGAPRAPGMKYRHYSPRAKVVLYEAGSEFPGHQVSGSTKIDVIGIIRTRKWKPVTTESPSNSFHSISNKTASSAEQNGFSLFDTVIPVTRPVPKLSEMKLPAGTVTQWTLDLGNAATDVARDLFWALRELDRKSCSVIYVEGISDEEGDVAGAVMNRLRKAAEVHVSR